MAKPDDPLARVLEIRFLLPITFSPVGIVMHRPVDVDDGVVLVIHEVRSCPAFRHENLGPGRQVVATFF